MKTQVTILLLLAISSLGMAQSGSIVGSVKTNSNLPLKEVNVMLINSSKGTLSNTDGTFELTGIELGEYTLSISNIGYKTQEIPIIISNGDNIDLGTIILYEGNEILSEVVIHGEQANKFSRKETAYVAKLPLKDIENTQVYSTVTNFVLESQIVTNFDDALKNATGVESLWSSTGRGGDGAGYYSLRGFAVQPQLVNGLPGLTNGTINSANIELIEVIKGPSATLFGSTVTSYGGLINVVTKKPYIGKGAQFSYTGGSFGFNQLTADFNTAIDQSEKLYFRLNTSYATEKSFQDAGLRKSFFVAPSLSYKVNNKLSFSFYAEITQAEQTNPTFLFLNRAAPSAAKNLEELGYNNELSFTSNDLTLENPTQNYRFEMNYNLSEKWQSQTLLSRSSTSTKGYYSYLYDFGILEGNTFSRYLNKQNSNTITSDIQQNFIGDFKIGSLRNRMVIGIDYLSVTGTDNSTGYAFYGNITPEGGSNGDNPFTPEIETDSYPLSTSAVDQVLASQPVGNSKSKYGVFSIYASDVLNITQNLSAMIGLRLDRFDSQGDVSNNEDDYDQTTLSPKLGLMYQPILNKLSIFANYQNGFTNVAPQLVGDPDEGAPELKTFKPEQANQFEFGVKTNLFKNRLSATLSYYDIKVTDRVITDPSSIFNKIQGGEIESSGIEFDFSANPINGLNIRGGFSHNESETTKSDNTEILNKRPLEAGPENVYNLWADYQIQKGNVKGLGFGFGFNGASERFAINYESTGDFILPSYTVVNASVYYQSQNYRIGLKLNNAFDEEYYKGWTTINPQLPRALFVNFTYRL